MSALPANARAWEAAISAALDQDDWRQRELAQLDAVSAMRFEIPDPEEYARYLPLRFRGALLGAYHSRRGLRVADEYVIDMRPYGLVEYGGPCLTAFALAVRRAVIAEERDG